MPKKKSATDELLGELRSFGLTYPGAHTKSPWPGHLDLAVQDKIFAHMSVEGEPFKISCKLPHSNALALSLPFAEPTRYGLGKSGWVSASASEGEVLPVAILKAWIDESYRAIAPKKLLKELVQREAGAQPVAKAAPLKKPRATTQKSPKKATKPASAKPASAAKKPASAAKKQASPKKLAK